MEVTANYAVNPTPNPLRGFGALRATRSGAGYRNR